MVGQEILGVFGLEPLQVERVEAGCINQTWRVVTQAGAFALRRHRVDSPAAVAAEQLVMKTAGGHGLPVPLVVPTRASEPFWHSGKALWSLSTWLPGQVLTPANLSPDLAYDLGATVARVHEALARLELAAFPVAPQHSAIEPVQALEKFATFRHLISLKGRLDEHDEFARAYFDLIEPRLRAGSPVLAYYRTAPGQVVHGDVWFQNVLFSGRQISGILDWEYTCVAPRLWELGYVFGCWLLHLDDYTRTEALTCAFLEGYGSAQPLVPREAGLVPEMYRWFRMNHVGPFYNHYVLGDSRTNQFLAPNVRQIRFVEEAGRDLRDRIERRLAGLRRSST
ncbi:MAG: aminoglycoside phosphotransferase [Symbiobacteriaceae bacterium]|jgi:homoserine kinase type II|nr:aminoglycoside phosphotransferase [Symbiobacteriaceae bacterium]